MSLSRVSHCASVRSRVLARDIESLQINRCKRVLCWLLLLNVDDRFEVSQLKDSIRTIGFLTVDRLVVTPLGGDRYVVIEGNRRLGAIQSLLEDPRNGEADLTEGVQLSLLNSSSAFGRDSHAAQVTVTRPEQTFGRQHQNEHVLATSTVAVPRVSRCCVGRSYTARRCGRITRIRAEARVLPKQPTKEQLSKCIGRIVPHDYCSRLEVEIRRDSDVFKIEREFREH